MRIDPSRFAAGDEWAYRQSDDAPSERVRILAVEPKKTSARLEIRFLDDPDERVEKVPGLRLRVPWNEVGTFDTLMANWQRIDDLSVDRTEEACVEEIFGLALWSAGVPKGEQRERIEEVLEVLPRIREFRTRRAGTLSGGQQQMVSIGRALLTRPKVLLLDEPSIGLAPKLFQDLIRPIAALRETRGMSILLVEQNVREAFAISDRVLVMRSGKFIFEGAPSELDDHAKLMELF